MGCSRKSFNNILFNNFSPCHYCKLEASTAHCTFRTFRALQEVAAQSSASSRWLPTDVKTKHSHPCIPALPDKWGASDVTFLKHLQLQSMSFSDVFNVCRSTTFDISCQSDVRVPLTWDLYWGRRSGYHWEVWTCPLPSDAYSSPLSILCLELRMVVWLGGWRVTSWVLMWIFSCLSSCTPTLFTESFIFQSDGRGNACSSGRFKKVLIFP